MMHLGKHDNQGSYVFIGQRDQVIKTLKTQSLE